MNDRTTRTETVMVKMINAVMDVWDDVDHDIAADAMIGTIDGLRDELSAFVAMDKLRERRIATPSEYDTRRETT